MAIEISVNHMYVPHTHTQTRVILEMVKLSFHREIDDAVFDLYCIGDLKAYPIEFIILFLTIDLESRSGIVRPSDTKGDPWEDMVSIEHCSKHYRCSKQIHHLAYVPICGTP